MRYLLNTAWALALFILGACAEAVPSARVTVRDSAGVEIMEIGELPLPVQGGWTVSAEPSLEIGVADGEEPYQFQLIRNVVRLSDGRIAVADGGASQIRFFDAAGRHLGSVGREGDGPGEFRLISSLFVRPGDSLIVVSGNTGTAYSAIPPAANTAVAIAFITAFYYPRHMLHDGRTVHVHYAGNVPFDREGVVRDSVLLIVADLPTALTDTADARETAAGTPAPAYVDQADIPADTIVRIAGNEEFRRRVGNGISNAGVPFGRRIETAADGDRLFVGIGTEGILNVYDAGGRLVRSIRFTGAREPLLQSEIDEWTSWRRSLARNDVQRQGVDALIAAITMPDERPVSGRILVDRQGSIWLERYAADTGYLERMDDSARRWYVLDPEGRVATAVDLPADFRVEEIGHDYILGVATDADGVETVRIHSLSRD